MAAGAAARVLVVTLDARTGMRLTRALTAAGYTVRWEWSSLTALAAVAEWSPALIVLDWDQPFIDGPTFTAAVQVGLASPPPVIALMTDDTAGVMQTGVAAYLSKPVAAADLVSVVGRIIGPPFPTSIDET